MSVNGQRKVVITGIGAVTPLGNDAETTWQRLLAGESGAGPITQFDSTDYTVHFACEVKDFDPSTWIERKQARRMDRFAQLVLSAARQAEADSGVDIASEGDRVGASIATGIGGLKSFQDCYDTLKERGPDRVNPFAIPCIIPNMGAGWVSMELGTRGPLSSECTACAASNMAIGQGLDDIRLGRAEVMFCGGTESAINQVGIAGFGAMRALSRRNDDPARASRPFDAGRDARSGVSLNPVDSAREAAKPATPMRHTAASAPPATMTSASSSMIRRAASPIAWAPVEQAVTTAWFGPLKP
jgi:3-oxoacyl-[acyl-carrier-protein] synthase II